MRARSRSIAWRLHDGERQLLLGAQVMVNGFVTIFAGALEALRQRAIGPLLSLPLALWTMHLAWGGAFLYSLVTARLRGSRA